MRTLMRRAVTATTATAILVGGGAIMASPAAAVGSSACTRNVADYTGWASTTVNLRSGPGTGYTSLGLLRKDTRFTVTCHRYSSWAYVTVRTGANAGKRGWVHQNYIAIAMNY